MRWRAHRLEQEKYDIYCIGNGQSEEPVMHDIFFCTAAVFICAQNVLILISCL